MDIDCKIVKTRKDDRGGTASWTSTIRHFILRCNGILGIGMTNDRFRGEHCFGV